MKTFFSYSVLIICIVIYFVSLSEPLTNQIARYKYKTKSIFRSDKYTYGDLFGMSFHPKFQLPVSDKVVRPMEKCDTLNKIVNLYALCDSYLWMIIPSDTFYCNVDKWEFATANSLNYLYIELDTSKSNVLLIELSERNTLYMLEQHFSYIADFLKPKGTLPSAQQSSESATNSNSLLFNKNINTNVEFNIFETALFTPIKKWKAALNFDFLKTPDENVAVGPDGQYLLYRPTFDPLLSTSSFVTVPDRQIDTAVNKLNRIYNHYKSMGFTEVYFSMIPNPVSILYPDFNGYKYNHLIERIQSHKSLAIPVIDIYSDFKSTELQIYNKSDSHWTKDGAIMWLNKLNVILRQFKK